MFITVHKVGFCKLLFGNIGLSTEDEQVMNKNYRFAPSWTLPLFRCGFKKIFYIFDKKNCEL